MITKRITTAIIKVRTKIDNVMRLRSVLKKTHFLARKPYNQKLSSHPF